MTSVCTEFGPGELVTCPAPGRTPGRLCDAVLFRMERQGRARVCLHGGDLPAPLPSPATVSLQRCPSRHCRTWLRVEKWEAP